MKQEAFWKARYKSKIIFLLLLSFVAVKEECVQKDLHWDLPLLFDDTRVPFSSMISSVRLPLPFRFTLQPWSSELMFGRQHDEYFNQCDSKTDPSIKFSASLNLIWSIEIAEAVKSTVNQSHLVRSKMISFFLCFFFSLCRMNWHVAHVIEYERCQKNAESEETHVLILWTNT